MKRFTKPNPTSPSVTPLRQLIHQATGAPADELAMIEHIMRDDIFHSTLDWQTAEQLRVAAREAFELFQENRDLYEFERKQIMSFFISTK